VTPVSLGAGTYAIGPQTGQLLLRTGREGMAARAGHDLVISFESWSGQVLLRSIDPVDAEVEVTVEIASIKILEGTGGVVPLTGRDRREITSTALRLLRADKHPRATFTSTSVSGATDGGSMQGTLTVGGQSTPVTIEVTGGGTWHGSTSVRQSAFGITPHKALLGALKVADEVRIDVDVDLVTP
jgi:polyisoprenoid-binding protein YceI